MSRLRVLTMNVLAPEYACWPERRRLLAGRLRAERGLTLAEVAARRYRTLLDRMSRMAGTAIPDPDNPNGPKVSPYADGNPADYQTRLTSIFNTIVAAPNIRLVK